MIESDALGHARLLAQLFAQRGAVFRIGAGDRERVAAAGFRTAAGDAAGKWQDHARGLGRRSRPAPPPPGPLFVAPRNQRLPPINPSRKPNRRSRRTRRPASARPTRGGRSARRETGGRRRKGDLAPQLEVGLGVEQVEASGGRTGQHVLADADQQRALERLDAVLAEPRDMELHDRAGAAVRRFEAASKPGPT